MSTSTALRNKFGCIGDRASALSKPSSPPDEVWQDDTPSCLALSSSQPNLSNMILSTFLSELHSLPADSHHFPHNQVHTILNQSGSRRQSNEHDCLSTSANRSYANSIKNEHRRSTNILNCYPPLSSTERADQYPETSSETYSSAIGAQQQELLIFEMEQGGGGGEHIQPPPSQQTKSAVKQNQMQSAISYSRNAHDAHSMSSWPLSFVDPTDSLNLLLTRLCAHLGGQSLKQAANLFHSMDVSPLLLCNCEAQNVWLALCCALVHFVKTLESRLGEAPQARMVICCRQRNSLTSWLQKVNAILSTMNLDGKVSASILQSASDLPNSTVIITSPSKLQFLVDNLNATHLIFDETLFSSPTNLATVPVFTHSSLTNTGANFSAYLDLHFPAKQPLILKLQSQPPDPILLRVLSQIKDNMFDFLSNDSSSPTARHWSRGLERAVVDHRTHICSDEEDKFRLCSTWVGEHQETASLKNLSNSHEAKLSPHLQSNFLNRHHTASKFSPDPTLHFFLIFTNTKKIAENVSCRLTEKHELLHGGWMNGVRVEALTRFWTRSKRVLVSTDLQLDTRDARIAENDVRQFANVHLHILHFDYPANKEFWSSRVEKTVEGLFCFYDVGALSISISTLFMRSDYK